MTTYRDPRIHARMIGNLYTDAMLLADGARDYFDEAGRQERDALDPLTRVGFSCESLKVTTRLMHVIAWLLTQRAVDAGELRPNDAFDPSRRLGAGPVTDPDTLACLPPQARSLIEASIELHRRVARLDTAQEQDQTDSPARSMLARLASAF